MLECWVLYMLFLCVVVLQIEAICWFAAFIFVVGAIVWCRSISHSSFGCMVLSTSGSFGDAH